MFVRDKGKPDKQIKELIKQAIIDGKNDFRGAFPWAFKEVHDTVTTTASEETVELPDDFEGLLSVVEHTSISGYKLRKYAPDSYDRLVPDSESLYEGTPLMYKVYFDDDVWKLSLYPTPNAAINLYITYHKMGDIPDKYIGGLKAAIAKHLAWPGSAEWQGAEKAFITEVERLKQVDNPDVEGISHFNDSSDEPTEHDWFVANMLWGPR